jgi:hypothetical protein
MRAYKENRALEDFFNVLSLSLDRNGVSYISTMEAKKVRHLRAVNAMRAVAKSPAQCL